MKVPPGHRIASVHCGFAFTLLRTTQGKLLACGFNQNGRLGISDRKCAQLCAQGNAVRTRDNDYVVLVPVEVDTLHPSAFVTDVACGSGHTLALLKGGQVLSWGRGEQGQLGDGRGRPATLLESFSVRVDHRPDEYKSEVVQGLPPVKSVACGSYFSAALTLSGDVYVWGGINSWRVATPMKLDLPEPIVKLDCSSMVAIMVRPSLHPVLHGG